MRASGVEAFLELLSNAGVRYLFGNPGTTELPFSDAVPRDARWQYILGLQEVPVMATADGYAMASRSLGVVNLHASCGLGNGMGMLYNAYREGTPLLVTAGQQDRRLKFEEPILTSDLAGVARPWTKWSAEVERVADLPAALRRAIQTALTPPTGPVFLAIPLDVQMEIAELDVSAPAPLDASTRPSAAALDAAAELLLSARNPAILAGGRIVERDAVEPLGRLAELLGAPILGESGTTHGRLAISPDHPLYGGCLPLWSYEVRERLAGYDVLFVTGMDLLRQYLYHEPRAIPEGAKIVQLDEDPWQLGKNYPLAVGLLGSTREGLTELCQRIEKRGPPGQREEALARGAALEGRHIGAREELWRKADEEKAARPLTPLAFMASVARALPRDAAVIEEAVTTTNTALERLGALRNATGYFGHRGWTLGWGLGCAVGVKLAWPERPVLATGGDGAAMYGIQALWTAARYRIPVTFVIPNNAQYQILKVGAKGMGLPAAVEGRFEGMDIVGPEIDFVGLAQSLGVSARRVTEADELSEAVRRALEGTVPQLIEAPITREVPGRLEY